MEAGSVTRRALFGRGIGRLLEERLAAIQPVAASASRPRAEPQVWGGGPAYRALGSLLEPAAAELAQAAGIGPGRRVLDVGMGEGDLAAVVARAGGDIIVRPEASRARLPFEDGEFDCVVSCFGATHAPAQASAVREMRRVVRPGGTLALTAWEPTGFMGSLLRVASRAAGDPGAGQAASWGRYEHAYRALGLLLRFEMHDRELELRFESGDDAWAALTGLGGPLAGPGNPSPAVREAFDTAIEAHRRPARAGVAIAAAYVVITAREPAA